MMRTRLVIAGLTFVAGAAVTFAAPTIAQAVTSSSPTYGRIPDRAFTANGVNADLVPDFVEALDRDGALVGYVASGPGSSE